jgi:excisionase family DNA binding protein
LEKKVLNTKGVAEYLGVSTYTIYRMLKKPDKYHLPAFKIRDVWCFNVESIDQWRKSLEGQTIE